MNEMNDETKIVQAALFSFLEKGYKDGDVLYLEEISRSLKIPEVTSIDQVHDNMFLLLQRIDELRHYLMKDHGIALNILENVGFVVRIDPEGKQSPTKN